MTDMLRFIGLCSSRYARCGQRTTIEVSVDESELPGLAKNQSRCRCRGCNRLA